MACDLYPGVVRIEPLLRKEGGRGGLATLREPIPVSGSTDRAAVRAPGRDSAPRRQGLGHAFILTSDFDAAWGSVPRPGIVVTEREIREDPVLRPMFEDWRSGDDSTYRRFTEGVLAWTQDEDEPN